MNVGRLETVDLRSVWQHEANNFTPWLLSNADRLSETLGINLELEAAEHSVGSFSLDLIGTDLDSGSRVIIENQLESTDHTHLGQILTYAGGTHPATIIWIAKQFREEHAAALTWLNENTDEDINFYGIQISAVKIGNSEPAALFDLVVRPNNWEKRVRGATASSSSRTSTQERYVRFWTRLNERVNELHPEWSSLMRKADNSNSWTTYSTGFAGVWYGISFAGAFGERGQFPGVKALRSEIYFGDNNGEVNRERYEAFQNRRAEIENLIGTSVSFESLETKKACRIALYTPGYSDMEDEWDNNIEFFIKSQEKLRHAVETLGGVAVIVGEGGSSD